MFNKITLIEALMSKLDESWTFEDDPENYNRVFEFCRNVEDELKSKGWSNEYNTLTKEGFTCSISPDDDHVPKFFVGANFKISSYYISESWKDGDWYWNYFNENTIDRLSPSTLANMIEDRIKEIIDERNPKPVEPEKQPETQQNTTSNNKELRWHGIGPLKKTDMDILNNTTSLDVPERDKINIIYFIRARIRNSGGWQIPNRLLEKFKGNTKITGLHLLRDNPEFIQYIYDDEKVMKSVPNIIK